MKSRALLDTGFLIAVLNADDEYHDTCVTAFLKETPKPLLPDMVVPELAYMILKERSYPILIDFLRTLVRGELVIERTSLEDLARAAELLEKYADSKIDLVDCIITAMAERLKIRRILTVDRRDFQLLRPKHCSHFEIVP